MLPVAGCAGFAIVEIAEILAAPGDVVRGYLALRLVILVMRATASFFRHKLDVPGDHELAADVVRKAHA